MSSSLNPDPKLLKNRIFAPQHHHPPTANSILRVKGIPELQGKSALGCYHGCVLLIDRYKAHNDNYGLSLWNPASFRALSLPLLPNELDEDICASVLTCPPEEEGSFILLFSRERAAVCGPGDPASVVRTPRMEGWDEHLHFAEVTVCNGVLYGWSYGFAMSNSTVMTEINSDGSNTGLYFRFSPRIVTKCCGEVYLIELSPQIGGILERKAGTKWKAWEIKRSSSTLVRVMHLKQEGQRWGMRYVFLDFTMGMQSSSKKRHSNGSEELLSDFHGTKESSTADGDYIKNLKLGNPSTNKHTEEQNVLSGKSRDPPVC
ncbi:hypothetical protein Cgig2_031979 [Carnegiea gigantea]|uniref:KIB1-4 beta-propeller domain-containing protein n=1 Tax=Carnegiea gigantea TaxID=171969 RepID=A0A9Q1QCR1_9CARY|nr:hypothetical protein Cgig2_031979 [Carnegiea gigantea]